jgi:hypothetical protein
MGRRVKWSRSDEGYVDSHCGRFDIVPLPMGTTRAQAYDLYYTDPFDLSRKRVTSCADTQSECKAEAEDFLARLEKGK